MPTLGDIESGAIRNSQPEDKIDSMARQLNEWGRAISNEDRTKIYYDNDGNARIIIGLLPDGTHGLVISKEGTDVLDVFD